MNKQLATLNVWVVALPTAVLGGILTGLFPAVLLAVSLSLTALFFLLRRPRFLLFSMFALVMLGQFGRLPPGSASGALLLLDILAGLLFLIWIVWWVQSKQKFNLTGLHLAWLGFLAIGAVMLIFNPFALPKSELAQNGFYLARLLSYSSLVWVIPQLFPGGKQVEDLVNWIVRVGVGVTLLGFLQAYIIPDIGFLAQYGWDPHVGRLVSTFLDPNYLGGFLAIILSLILARSVRENQKFPWLLAGLILVATVLTFSRSGYLAVALVSLLYGLRYSWKLLLIGLICLIPLTLTIPRVRERIGGGFSLDQTSQARLQSWSNALIISDTYPLLGVGYNNYQSAQQFLGMIPSGSQSRAAAGSDSSLLNVFATTGIFGLSLFLLSALLVLKRCRIILREKKPSVRGSVALALLMVAPSLFLHAFFVNAYFYPFILLTLSSLVGVLYVQDRNYLLE